MRILLVVIMLSFVVNAERVLNRQGLDEDTSIISDFSVDSTKYTKWFVLTDGEDARVAFKFDDTSSAGFSGDSLAVIVGYQTGMPVFSSCGSDSYNYRDIFPQLLAAGSKRQPEQ